jgi:NADPH:quinone reductase-like Zn-dependent oxidoreductase
VFSAGAIVNQLASLLGAGSLRAVIDREFTLQDSVAALMYLKEGHAAGKVVVLVGSGQTEDGRKAAKREK